MSFLIISSVRNLIPILQTCRTSNFQSCTIPLCRENFPFILYSHQSFIIPRSLKLKNKTNKTNKLFFLQKRPISLEISLLLPLVAGTASFLSIAITSVVSKLRNAPLKMLMIKQLSRTNNLVGICRHSNFKLTFLCKVGLREQNCQCSMNMRDRAA